MYKQGAPGSRLPIDGGSHVCEIILGLAVAVSFVFAVSGYAQISPGPLARAHQSLNGSTNCTKCHQISTGAPSFRCVECHKEIAAELQQNKGLHATYPRAGAPGSACVKCHSDHNGADFQMIHWTPTASGFDHPATGFALDGKHSGVMCRACHNAQHISSTAKELLGSKDLSRTWMGLTPSCGSCHEDKHQGRFGQDCARCHSTIDWKTAAENLNDKTFDHSKTRYPLTGAHRSVLCKSCHASGAEGQPRYTGLRFDSCSDCHRDPHKGQFKQTCETCHNTASWKNSPYAAKFDHSKTDYPLIGKHLTVSCVSCHEGGDFKSPIAHAACADCHKPDPHGGQFAHRPDGGRCETCHTVQGWSPSTFSIADHAKTGFPLNSPHESVKCAQCHVPAGTATRFKVKFARCVDCHEDEHQGQFAGAPWLNRCEKCHTGATFKNSSYSLTAHGKSSFPLTGAHAAVPCNECHKPMPGTKLVRFHFAQHSCSTCHEDVHKGQFARRMAVRDVMGRQLGCEACHSTGEWKDLSRFNHDQTGFPLVGSHKAVTCIECHKPLNTGTTLKDVNFSSAPLKCSECHNNPHAEQFGKQALECASCHNTNKWRPSLFDHETTQFPLKGGHENVACSACHTLRKNVGGKSVLFYKPTPRACEACHGANIPKPSGSARLHNTLGTFGSTSHAPKG
jgi:hypothetical protein